MTTVLKSLWNLPQALAMLAFVVGNAFWSSPKDEAPPPGAVARFGSARLRTTAIVFALAVDGKILHTVGGGHIMGRWDNKNERLLGEVQLKAPRGAECWFSPDRRFVAAIDSEGVGLYDAETGERKRTVAPQ